MPLGTEVGLGPGHIMLDGNTAPPKKTHSPQLSASVRCDPTAGWIKMSPDTEVALGPGHRASGSVTLASGALQIGLLLLLDGTQFPSPKRGKASPIFGPCPLSPNRWMD